MAGLSLPIRRRYLAQVLENLGAGVALSLHSDRNALNRKNYRLKVSVPEQLVPEEIVVQRHLLAQIFGICLKKLALESI